MNIISKDFTGLVKALLNMGCTDFAAVTWIAQPIRKNGRWRAKVAL